MALYSDLDFNLTKSTTNDFNILGSLDTIKQSIRHNLLSRVGFHTKYEEPDFGSGIFDLLSEKPSRFVAIQIKNEMETAIENYENRITVDDLTVEFDQENNLFIVNLTYTIISTLKQETLNLTIDVIS